MYSRTLPQYGYSMLYTVMILAMVGLSIPVLNQVVQSYFTEKTEETKAHVEVIQEAISSHVESQGFLPCPASMKAARGDSEYGKAGDCTNATAPGITRTDTGRDGRFVRIGALPVRSLNLPEVYMMDSNNKPFVYAVTELLTGPATYSNEEGGIFVVDGNNADADLTSAPGTALYTVVSMGKVGSLSDCNESKLEGENCDGDARFRDNIHDGRSSVNLNALSSQYFDDYIAYSEMEPQSPYGLCGTKGKLYAPGHPDGDEDNCIDVLKYEKYQSVRLTDEQSVTCTGSDEFCDGSWIDLMDLTQGNYIINWDFYLRFDHAQPEQYALIEFEADGNTDVSPRLPFQGSVCADVGSLQHESGVVSLDVSGDVKLKARLRFYGGENNPAVNGCPGKTPAAYMLQQGEGSSDTVKVMTVNAMRRLGPGKGHGTSVATGAGAAWAPEEAIVASVEGDKRGGDEQFEIVRTDGRTETGSNQILKAGDTVKAGKGVTEVVFNDGTEITLVEGAELEIREYSYDPGSKDNKARFGFLRGVFLFVSGLMDEKKVELETTYGSAGLRGTVVYLAHIPGDKSVFAVVDGKIQVYHGGDKEYVEKYEVLEISPGNSSKNGQSPDVICDVHQLIPHPGNRAHMQGKIWPMIDPDVPDCSAGHGSFGGSGGHLRGEED